MKFDPRLRSPFVLGVALALGACTAPSAGDPNDSTLDAGDDLDVSARRHHLPPPPDARPAPTDARPTDAGGGGGGGGDPAGPGIVSCFTEGNPGATCALPSQCCFGNYNAQHDGECSTSACTWGTIDCDGPEDCGTGQHCCAHVMIDPDWGILGYKLACQTTACGAAPANQEMCHTTTSTAGTCGSGRSCVTTQGNDSDLPPSLHICK